MANEYKRLYRSVEDRMIAGVCAGIADYFERIILILIQH